MTDTYLLNLVRKALDEFDDQYLEVSARRAFRLARARGDSEIAHRLSIELRPLGGSDRDRILAISDIHEGLSDEEVWLLHSDYLEDYIAARRPERAGRAGNDDRVILGGSIAEMRHFLEQVERSQAEAIKDDNWVAAGAGILNIADRREVLERLHQWVFGYLVLVESQLAASDTVTSLLASHRASVDTLLSDVAPDLRDQLGSALRAAMEGDSESRSQVLVTCRRVIEAVADHMYPASQRHYSATDGTSRSVTQKSYRNRILAAADSASTAEKTFFAALEDLATRLARLDELVNRGVHANVSREEMEFGLAQTYLLAGELLSFHASLGKGRRSDAGSSSIAED